MRLFEDINDLTSGIKPNIIRALDKSIENNSIETNEVIKSFIRKVLQLSIKEKSLKHFKEYIFLPATFYSLSFDKKLHDLSLEYLHKICSDQSAVYLKEIIWFDLGYKSKQVISISERKTLNEFYYWAFNGFSHLLYLTVKNKDHKQFKYSLEEYEQISDSISNQNYDLKFKIRKLQRENIDGRNSEKIQSLKEELTLSSQFETYKRHVLLGIKYWILFLYQIDQITEELTVILLSELKIPYHDSNDVLNDILFFRNNDSNNYLGWSEWDFTERQSGKVYSPPIPLNWLTLGFMADQIRENKLYINLEEFNYEELKYIRFLYDNLKKYAKTFKNDFDKWKKVLNVETIEQFNQTSNQVLSLFATLKRKSIGKTEKDISLAQLSQNKIKAFRKLTGKAWFSQAHINRLFKKIGTIEIISNDETKLKNIGRRIFFEKAKMMFIEGENNQQIFGIDKLGFDIGLWEDSEFFNTITQTDHNKVTGSSILEVLNKTIAQLKSQEVIPDLILMSPEHNYKNTELLNSKLFTPKNHTPNNKKDITSLLIGKFDSIPIYTSKSEFIKNRILVCNFKNAFKMRYKTDLKWFNNVLKVDITKVTNEEAHRRLKEHPDKWKMTEDDIKLDDKDALTLIKTSVIIDCWSTLDFQILDSESFILGYLKTEIDENVR